VRNRRDSQTVQRRIERFARALDAPSLDLVGPVEIDEVYVSAEKKGRERTGSRARVACLRVGADRLPATSQPCLSLSIMVLINGT